VQNQNQNQGKEVVYIMKADGDAILYLHPALFLSLSNNRKTYILDGEPFEAAAPVSYSFNALCVNIEKRQMG
jgi:hypothetical protein